MPTTGEEIPPEIIGLVLERVAYPITAEEMMMKRQCSALSKVCRFWANFCRMWVFRRITLRSEDDIRDFRALLGGTPPAGLQPIHYLTSVVRAVVTHPSIPWVHTIPSIILPILKQHPSNVAFEISWQPLASVGLGTPLHPSLPRSLPSLYTPVTSLTLRDVSFSSAAQLNKVLRGLVYLRVLELVNIGCKRPPNEQSFVRTWFGAGFATLSTFSEKLMPHAVWFIPALLASCAQHQDRFQAVWQPISRPKPVPTYIMDLEEYPILLSIIHLFEHTEPAAGMPYASVHNNDWYQCPDCKQGSTTIHQRISVTVGEAEGLDRVSVYAMLSIRLSPKLIDACSVDGAYHRHRINRSPTVMAVTGIDLTVSSTFEDRLACVDWAAFTKLVLALPYLRDSRCVGIAFQSATADLEKFVREHSSALRPLIDSTILNVKGYHSGRRR